MRALADVPGISLYAQGVFELPVTTWSLPAVQAVARLCHVDLPEDARPIRQPLTTAHLYPHQRAGIEWLVSRIGGGLLADDMGLGKTRQACVAAENLRPIQGCVVIVGPLFTRDVWRRELLATGAIGTESDFCALETRNFDHKSFRKGCPYYFLHYDIVSAWWSKLYQLRPTVGIADEVHWARNGRAARSKGVAVLLGTCAHRFLLTGTPMENRPSDLWHLLALATGASTWGSPLAFRKRYCGATYNGFGWQDGEPTHTAELRARMESTVLRRTADDTSLSLPPITRHVQTCEISAQALADHRKLLPPAEILSLVRAIAAGSVQEVLPQLSKVWQSTSKLKLPTTVDTVENALAQGESVLVFVWQRETAHTLAGRLSSSVTITGDLAQRDRDAIVADFQAGTKPVALIATYGALREGVTLHRARIVVHHDLHWLLTALLQAEARIYRIGQTRACESIWMIAAGTIDALLAPLLMRKAEAMSAVLGQTKGEDSLHELALLEAAGSLSVDQQLSEALDAWRVA